MSLTAMHWAGLGHHFLKALLTLNNNPVMFSHSDTLLSFLTSGDICSSNHLDDEAAVPEKQLVQNYPVLEIFHKVLINNCIVLWDSPAAAQRAFVSSSSSSVVSHPLLSCSFLCICIYV